MAELDLDDLAVFVRVVDRGSFAAAAREIGTPTSTVSRAVIRLESRGGVRLLQRTTRAVTPTVEGREFYAAVAPAVTAIQTAAQALDPAGKRPKGRVRVAAANDLCSGFLAEVITAFLERHPLVDLEFVVDNAPRNLVAGGFDLALRATPALPDSSLVARKLGIVEHRLFAAPSYLACHGAPASWRDLERHRCVVFRGDALARTWKLERGEETFPVAVRGRLGGDDFAFVRALVAAGAGIGLLPHLNAARLESEGRLVRVLPDLHAKGAALYLVYPTAKQVPARVVAFREFVVAAFAAWSSG